jgi:DNA-binding IclR family transcriptional regulator
MVFNLGCKLIYNSIKRRALRLSAGIGGRSIALQDIAAEIGMTREVLYRTLAALETEGHLTRTQTAILLRNSNDV